MLYKTHDTEDLSSCLIDSGTFIMGITKDGLLIGKDTASGRVAFSIDLPSNPEAIKTIYDSVRLIIVHGGQQAAFSIGHWNISQHEEYLQRLLDLHFVYCMPEESHYHRMLKKNPLLVKLVKRLDLSLS